MNAIHSAVIALLSLSATVASADVQFNIPNEATAIVVTTNAKTGEVVEVGFNTADGAYQMTEIVNEDAAIVQKVFYNDCNCRPYGYGNGQVYGPGYYSQPPATEYYREEHHVREYRRVTPPPPPPIIIQPNYGYGYPQPYYGPRPGWGGY